MRLLRLQIGFLFVCVSAGSAVHAQSRSIDVEAGPRVALVIGNAEYQHASPLQNPVNDAVDMADALTDVGFSVHTHTNLSYEEMGRALAAFAADAEDADVALFFYAGHGVQVGGDNFLVPVDANVATESQMRYRSMDLGEILSILDDSGARLKLVFLDACRDNPFRSWRSTSGGWASTQGPSGSVISFATAQGERASDHTAGRNGLFTTALLDQIRTPGLELTRLLRNVQQRVRETSSDEQEPWTSMSYAGDFYFVQAEPGDPEATAAGAVRPSEPSPPASDASSSLNRRVEAALSRLAAGDTAAVASVLAAAANAGHAEAQSVVGWMTLRGSGVDADPAAGLRWLQAAVAQGHAGAQTNLGFAYETGLGVGADPVEAARLYGLAAAQGRAMAQNNLAALLQRGDGPARNLPESVRLFEHAAAQGLAVAQANLGLLYETGTGVPTDPARAAGLYEQAALQGHAVAMTRLAVLLHRGEGVPVDPDRALGWLQRAAELGQPHARAILAAWAAQSPAPDGPR